MALANLDAYLAALQLNGPQLVTYDVAAATVVAGRHYDLWKASVPVGATPTTAAAPTGATLGAIEFPNGGAGRLSILGARWGGLSAGSLLICDRLSHQGGLSGTVVGAQTTNLPTAALTRWTDGAGVMIGLTVYTAIGTTATTVTVSYTNEAGAAGHVSPAVAIGATGFNAANRMIQIPFAAGDYGCRSVESVSLAGSTVSAAGNFGVTLYKPLYVIGMESVRSSLSLLSSYVQASFPQ